jgi:hypothetical protein
MCKQCKRLDRRIANYQEMAVHIFDEHISGEIAFLIAKLEADKKALHPQE